jgi:hypothetical protein
MINHIQASVGRSSGKESKRFVKDRDVRKAGVGVTRISFSRSSRYSSMTYFLWRH